MDLLPNAVAPLPVGRTWSVRFRLQKHMRVLAAPCIFPATPGIPENLVKRSIPNELYHVSGFFRKHKKSSICTNARRFWTHFLISTSVYYH